MSALRQDLEDKNKGLSGEQTLEDMVTDVPQDNKGKKWRKLLEVVHLFATIITPP